MANTYINSSEVLYKLNRCKEAKEDLDKAIKLYKEIFDDFDGVGGPRRFWGSLGGPRRSSEVLRRPRRFSEVVGEVLKGSSGCLRGVCVWQEEKSPRFVSSTL